MGRTHLLVALMAHRPIIPGLRWGRIDTADSRTTGRSRCRAPRGCACIDYATLWTRSSPACDGSPGRCTTRLRARTRDTVRRSQSSRSHRTTTTSSCRRRRCNRVRTTRVRTPAAGVRWTRSPWKAASYAWRDRKSSWWLEQDYERSDFYV